MTLAAAKFRKFFPSLLVPHDDYGCVLEIHPVRGSLYRLYDLLQSVRFYWFILIGSDGAVGQ